MTVTMAHWPGTCPLCSRAYPAGARIANTPYGWGHDKCVAQWRENMAMVAGAH